MWQRRHSLDSDYLDRVVHAALKFRHALQEPEGLECPSLQRFPAGACGDTSDLLARFLLDEGLGEWDHVSGCDTTGQTHAWIEREGWIVDITADQFGDVGEPVTVTTERQWHERFSEDRRRRSASLDGSVLSSVLWSDYAVLAARARSG